MTESKSTVANLLMDVHHALENDLEALEKALVSASPAEAKSVPTRLEHLEKELIAHFQFEEKGGYMAVWLEIRPELAETIERLRNQHDDLRTSVRSLIEQAQESPECSEPLRKSVLDWIQTVRDHEYAENQIVQESANRDVGGHD